jgi:POT family proton-dependent oligopeptide transporter
LILKRWLVADALLSGFQVTQISLWSSRTGVQASWIWLVVWFFVYTVGELFILPVGLGLFGRMAPAGFAATAIAAWFFASFVGNFAAGALGTLWGAISPAAFFALTGGVAGLSGVLLLSLAPWSQRVQRDHADSTASAALEPAE